MKKQNLTKLKKVIKEFFVGLGAIWLTVEICSHMEWHTVGHWILFITPIAWFCYCWWKFSKRSIVIKSNAFQTKITVEFDDIFKKDGWIVIGVNDFFDSLVNDQHVSSSSLHGQMLEKYWSGNATDWDKQVNESIKDSTTCEEIKNRSSGKQKRYHIGTVASVEKNSHKFLCVALSKTNVKTRHTEATIMDIYLSIKNVLKKVVEVKSQKQLNFPLLGSGRSRTGIKLNVLIDMILWTIFEECKKMDLGCDVRIVLPKEEKNSIDLISLQENWS